MSLTIDLQAQIPENVNVSIKDIEALGITFTDTAENVKISFEVTDVILEINKKNAYVLFYNENNRLIEFGCLSQADPSQKGVYVLNERFYIPVTPTEGIEHKTRIIQKREMR